MRQFTPAAPLRGLLDELATLARAADLEAYVVGGTVRDVLLGRATHDVDVAVRGDALAWARELADRLGGHFVTLDDENAVARVVLDDPRGVYIDVATVQGTLDDDMRRRDFTVDALAVPLGGGEVIDVCGGLADLDAAVLRMNGEYVFEDDPLRMLRGARLAAELGFRIDEATAAAIRARASPVVQASPERQRDELARIFALPRAEPGIRLLDGLGLLDVVLPDLAAGRGVSQPPEFHAYDVFEHDVHCVAAMDDMLAEKPPTGSGGMLWDGLWRIVGWHERALRSYLAEELTQGRTRASLLKLAALLHDVAKPATRTVDGRGRIRFFGHGDAGAESVTRTMRHLRFSGAEIKFVATLVAEHLRPVQLAPVGEAPTRRALYRFYRALGDALPAVLLLALADAAAARGPAMTAEGWSRQVAYMNSLLVRSREEEGIVHPPRLLTGDDIMSTLGLREGPAIGRYIEALQEAQAAGDVASREAALEFVKKLAREGNESGR
jgi:tRNA nucleotidyltransferase/poly(A) polymerase